MVKRLTALTLNLKQIIPFHFNVKILEKTTSDVVPSKEHTNVPSIVIISPL